MRLRFAVFSFLFAISLLLNGCKDDPCQDVLCLNGVCVSGVCSCDEGYEGESCGTLSRDKFLHSIWYNNRSCPGATDLLLSKIEVGSSQNQEIRIFNLNSSPDTVTANVSGDTAWIPLQVYGVEYIEGRGIYADGGIVFEYERVETGGGRTDCIAYFSH